MSPVKSPDEKPDALGAPIGLSSGLAIGTFERALRVGGDGRGRDAGRALAEPRRTEWRREGRPRVARDDTASRLDESVSEELKNRGGGHEDSVCEV